MISTLMADTRYRGRILWMLLTCRPDLIPVDLKRQGRCEVHLPLFAPETEEERRQMFIAMARKNDVEIDETELPHLPAGLTGADIESLLVQCVRAAAIDGEKRPETTHIEQALSRFRPPDYGLEKELQELVAIRESTDQRFIPERLRQELKLGTDSSELENRIQAIRQLLPNP